MKKSIWEGVSKIEGVRHARCSDQNSRKYLDEFICAVLGCGKQHPKPGGREVDAAARQSHHQKD